MARRQTVVKRSPVRKKRPGKPRRGRVVDKDYLEWMGETQSCLVSGRRPVTLHHVREFGSPKNDRRTVPLIAELHLYEAGMQSVERLGKAKFQRIHKVNFEVSISEYNRQYKAEKGE